MDTSDPPCVWFSFRVTYTSVLMCPLISDILEVNTVEHLGPYVSMFPFMCPLSDTSAPMCSALFTVLRVLFLDTSELSYYFSLISLFNAHLHFYLIFFQSRTSIISHSQTWFLCLLPPGHHTPILQTTISLFTLFEMVIFVCMQSSFIFLFSTFYCALSGKRLSIISLICFTSSPLLSLFYFCPQFTPYAVSPTVVSTIHLFVLFPQHIFNTVDSVYVRADFGRPLLLPPGFLYQTDLFSPDGMHHR